ncbi:uncharacterized protein EI90DRAFT_3136659 [Cantharellus anzutake]|uniref:uncharacterized protein n=1 Tax=Cantharellus anzutake TaxID=1750568 RepID=UPI001907DC16|nr:uncharacterized protein EI90DRAFT_3136659 [Cantharellus anzutake]KAF8313499.1 hypothetical protein EI90DRAFT_3136659 [Cantharellus anzutake]
MLFAVSLLRILHAALSPGSSDRPSSSSSLGTTIPPAHAHVKRCATDDLEQIMSFSSSSNCIVSSSPLHSTFELPKHAYGHLGNLSPIKWDLTDNCDLALKTQTKLMKGIYETWHEFQKVKVLVERAINAVDATNAQLALGGMYVSKVQTQLLTWEETEKSKEDGGRIKGTFGRVVTHQGFLRDQAKHNQRKLDEGELERLKEEAREWWKKLNEAQKAEVARWHEEKGHFAALKQKVSPKPSEVLMRAWMAENYPQLQQNKNPVTLEALENIEQAVMDRDNSPA